jgi:cytochrome c oxidase assembly factor CtaG
MKRGAASPGNQNFSVAAFGTLLLVSCSTPTAHAHGSEAHDTPASSLLSQWTPNLWVIAAILISSLLYGAGQRALLRRSRGLRARLRLECTAFVVAQLSLALALLSPVDHLSDLMFSAHMFQHELLMLVAAPLWVLARPLQIYVWALPARLQQTVWHLVRAPGARRVSRILTNPWLTLGIHGLVRWLWHAPLLFEAALRNEWLHGAQHGMFFATALLFWWSIVQGRYGRLGYGVSVLFVFATAMHTGALGALVSLATSAWYPLYIERGRVLSIDAVWDQHVAGMIMWVGAGLVLMIIGLALLSAWLGEAHRRARRGTVAALVRENQARTEEVAR